VARKRLNLFYFYRCLAVGNASTLFSIRVSDFMSLQNPEGPQPWTRDWNGKSEDIVFDMNASERVRIL